MEPNEIIAIVISIFTTFFAVAGMQFKSMKVIIASQLIANSLLGVQYILEDRLSASGIVMVAIVLTIISFIFTYKKKNFPIWLTVLFCIAFTAVSILSYQSAWDLLPLIAVWVFAWAMVQKASAVYRSLALCNGLLWLIYDIALAPSAILTHAVIIAFTVIGIIRQDRAEWATLFKKIFKKKDIG
jgi:hypothetical protein